LVCWYGRQRHDASLRSDRESYTRQLLRLSRSGWRCRTCMLRQRAPRYRRVKVGCDTVKTSRFCIPLLLGGRTSTTWRFTKVASGTLHGPIARISRKRFVVSDMHVDTTRAEISSSKGCHGTVSKCADSASQFERKVLPLNLLLQTESTSFG
jgi:hypothetical protein